MKYIYEIILGALIITVVVVYFTDQANSQQTSTKVTSITKDELQHLTESQRRIKEESWESFEAAVKYDKALVIEEAYIRTNSNYQSTYYFTVRNASDETIVAFDLEGEKYRVNLKPNKTYSGKMKAKTDMISLYKVNSIVLANGELIYTLKESTTRKH